MIHRAAQLSNRWAGTSLQNVRLEGRRAEVAHLATRADTGEEQSP